MNLARIVGPNNPKIRSIIIVATSLAFSLMFLILLYAYPGSSFSAPGFTGYTALLVPREVDAAAAETALAAELGSVVSKRSTLVGVSVFAGTQQIPVGELSERLESEDPRLDPYGRAVAQYFETDISGSPMEVMYVKTDLSAGRLLSWLRKNGFGAVRVHGFNSAQRFIVVSGFFIFAAVLMWCSAGFRMVLIAACVPWFILIGSGWVRAYLPGAAFLIGTFYWAKALWPNLSMSFAYGAGQFDKREIGRAVATSACCTAVILLSIVFPSFDSQLLFGVFLSQLASASCFVCLLGLRYLEHHGRAHRIFAPMPILSGISLTRTVHTDQKKQLGERIHRLFYTAISRRQLPSIALVAMLIVVPTAADFVSGMFSFTLPAPAAVEGVTSFTWEDIERLSIANHVRQLPDIADYLTHAAYQRGVPYGRNYTFPYRGEVLNQRIYRQDGGRVIGEEKAVLQFDEDWFTMTIDHASDSGLTAMFLAQSKPVGVGYAPADQGLLSVSYALISLILWLAALLPFIAMVDDLTAQLIYGTRSLISRRKRQAA